MLKTLPDSLSYVGDLIDSIKESDRTCEFLKNKIAMWETRGQGESGKKKTSVFKVEKKDVKCYGCEKNGHSRKECRNTWRGGANGGAHQPQGQQQPPRPHYQPQQYRSRGGRGYGQRGRGRVGSHATTEQVNMTRGTPTTKATTAKELQPF